MQTTTSMAAPVTTCLSATEETTFSSAGRATTGCMGSQILPRLFLAMIGWMVVRAMTGYSAAQELTLFPVGMATIF